MEVMSLGVGQLVRLELSPPSYSPEIEAWNPGRKCGWCRKSWHYHRLAGAKNLMFSSTELLFLLTFFPLSGSSCEFHQRCQVSKVEHFAPSSFIFG